MTESKMNSLFRGDSPGQRVLGRVQPCEQAGVLVELDETEREGNVEVCEQRHIRERGRGAREEGSPAQAHTHVNVW